MHQSISELQSDHRCSYNSSNTFLIPLLFLTLYITLHYITLHLADAFIQSDLK